MQADPQGDNPITAINVTPLVDVSLVLVIIFMITMPFLVEKGMKIKSSAQKITAVSSVTEPILVEISEKGVTIEGQIVEKGKLIPLLKKIMGERGVYAVSVAPGLKIQHGEVVKVIDSVITAGAKDLNLLEPGEAGNGRN